MRCFISAEIPEHVRKEIKIIQDKLPEFDGKKTEFQNLHLTLKFLGEVDKSKLELIKDKLRRIRLRKLNVKIDFLGVFSSATMIIWLHIDDCGNLHREIDNSLRGILPSEHRFMSHLTIARVKQVKNKKNFLEELNNIKIPEIRFSIDEFQLKESLLKSKGSTYKTLESYQLT